MTPSQRKRRPKRHPKCAPGDHYTPNTYYRAITRACKKAKASHWHPHQLRHSFGTTVRKQFGLEAARAALGHRSMEITQVYVELDQTLVKQIIAKMGLTQNQHGGQDRENELPLDWPTKVG